MSAAHVLALVIVLWTPISLLWNVIDNPLEIEINSYFYAVVSIAVVLTEVVFAVVIL